MAPKRRSTSARNATAPHAQSTLSFTGKNHRVSKPSKTSPGKDVKIKEAPAIEDEIATVDGPAQAEPDLDEPTTADAAIAQQAEIALDEDDAQPDYEEDLLEGDVKVEDVLGGRAERSEIGATGASGSGWVGDEEKEARKVSKKQIEAYWRAKESERLVPRVHQEGLGTGEKVLREWDMSGQYGPCIGIARLKRWKRANVLGLKPPVEVLAVLLQEMEKGDSGKLQRAHVDELMSSRFVET